LKHRKILGHRNFLSHSKFRKMKTKTTESQHFSMLRFLDGHSYRLQKAWKKTGPLLFEKRRGQPASSRFE
jgi:hypothetical protein